MTWDPVESQTIRATPVEYAGDFYRLVPKEPRENMEWRRKAVKIEGIEARQNAWIMCKRDILFFAAGFCWLLEPRDSKCPVKPFLPYKFQEDFIAVILECLERGKPICCVKTRGMGLTWMIALVFVWLLIFHERRMMACMSRVENLVDETGDPDTIMAKMDFIIEMLPGWLRPRTDRSKLHLKSMDSNSTIDGASTTGSSFRGGRRYVVFVDEHAHIKTSDARNLQSALQSVADCRIYGSTPNGIGNMFHSVSMNEAWEQVRLHWTMHPIYSKGKKRDRYGKWTSPWYESQCKELGHKQLIAQELDMDFLASQFSFFEAEHMAAVRAGVREPELRGSIECDMDTGDFNGFTRSDGGEVLLWVKLDEAGNPPHKRSYVTAADISAGTGSSNSCITVWDEQTGEQVLEYATPHMTPERLAAVFRAICRWFGGTDGESHAIWENNGGHGAIFTRKVMEMGLSNFHSEKRGSGIEKAGQYTGPDEKSEGMQEWRAAIVAGKCVVRSKDMADECQQYVYKRSQAGKLTVDFGNIESDDPTGAGEAHGDRATTGWLAWKAIRMRGRAGVDKGGEPAHGTMAWLLKEIENDQKPTKRHWLPRPGESGYKTRMLA